MRAIRFGVLAALLLGLAACSSSSAAKPVAGPPPVTGVVGSTLSVSACHITSAGAQCVSKGATVQLIGFVPSANAGAFGHADPGQALSIATVQACAVKAMADFSEIVFFHLQLSDNSRVDPDPTQGQFDGSNTPAGRCTKGTLAFPVTQGGPQPTQLIFQPDAPVSDGEGIWHVGP